MIEAMLFGLLLLTGKWVTACLLLGVCAWDLRTYLRGEHKVRRQHVRGSRRGLQGGPVGRRFFAQPPGSAGCLSCLSARQRASAGCASGASRGELGVRWRCVCRPPCRHRLAHAPHPRAPACKLGVCEEGLHVCLMTYTHATHAVGDDAPARRPLRPSRAAQEPGAPAPCCTVSSSRPSCRVDRLQESGLHGCDASAGACRSAAERRAQHPTRPDPTLPDPKSLYPEAARHACLPSRRP